MKRWPAEATAFSVCWQQKVQRFFEIKRHAVVKGHVVEAGHVVAACGDMLFGLTSGAHGEISFDLQRAKPTIIEKDDLTVGIRNQIRKL